MTGRRHPRRWPAAALAVAAVAAGLVVAAWAVAEARPGGGDSYSGGGGHDGNGGGGGLGVLFQLLFELLVRLCIHYPKIGIPLTCVVIGFLIWGWRVRSRNRDWDSGPPVQLERSITLDAVRQVDPDFSAVLFEDFAFRLYATAQQARGRPGALDELAPYLSEGARGDLARRQPVGAPVTGVVIGAMRVHRVEVPPREMVESGARDHVTVSVELETNYTVGAGRQQRTKFAVERWTFARKVGARTRPPDPARTFPCPNCGAPWQGVDSADGQRCTSCGEVVDNGRFDWQVIAINLRHERDQPPTLTREVEERGTDLPSYVQPGLDGQWARLLRDDPALSDAGLIARLHLIYRTLNASWTAGDLTPARGLVSDGLHDYLWYWMSAYRAQGLRNVLEDMRITHQQPVKVTRDRWYHAITIRIWGTGKDYVIRTADGSHVRGSRRRERRYSEYWTLIRSASRHGPPRGDPACGNCGAPLAVTMAGACSHCGAHLTAGEFDWVLSKIEQDDSYRG